MITETMRELAVGSIRRIVNVFERKPTIRGTRIRRCEINRIANYVWQLEQDIAFWQTLAEATHADIAGLPEQPRKWWRRLPWIGGSGYTQWEKLKGATE